MMGFSARSRFAGLVLATISVVATVAAVDSRGSINNSPGWTWRLGTDSTLQRGRSIAELDTLLHKQDLWFTYHVSQLGMSFAEGALGEGARLSLEGANLSGLKLANAHLDCARLDSANLSSSKIENCTMKFVSLRAANLAGAQVTPPSLWGANLAQADLRSAGLSGVEAPNSSFVKANLDQADISNSVLSYAKLFGASMYHTNISDADFSKADLSCVRYESVGGLPDIPAISQADGLRRLKYELDPGSLIALRSAFAERGFRQQEREVICAIQRHDQGWLETILFDWPSEWGSNLSRPWEILVFLWIVSAAWYYISVLGESEAGIRIIVPMTPERFRGEIGHNEVTPKCHGSTQSEALVRRSDDCFWLYAGTTFSRIPWFLRLIWWAFFYSTMSTFNIGFRDINFGRWLRLLTRKEFDLQAFGWTRLIAGLQALISVYLVALWALSFAGTPFG